MPRVSGRILLLGVCAFYLGLMLYLQLSFGAVNLFGNAPEEPVIHAHERADPVVQPKQPIPKVEPPVSNPVDIGSNLTFRSACDGRRYTDSYFVRVTENVYVYAAYLDERHDERFVRMMILKDRSRPELYCHFTTKSGAQIAVPSQNIKGEKFAYYELCENHGAVYGGYILSCPVPDKLRGADRPCSVRLSPSSQASKAADGPVLPLRFTDGSVDRFGMCVPALHGSVPTDQLIEFIEASRSMGAQKIVLYFADGTSLMRTILQHYIKKGVVEVIPWMMPQNVAVSNWNFAQILNVNDCLYRSMGQSKYVAFNDIDEFMVPRDVQPGGAGKSPWAGLVAKVWQENYCGICLRSVFFDPHRQEVGEKGSSLRTLSWTKRSSVESMVRTKCMVQPLRIYEMGIHHISKPRQEHYVNPKVEGKYALLHHYRQCLGDYGMSCDRFEEDLSLQRSVPHIPSLVERLKGELKV